MGCNEEAFKNLILLRKLYLGLSSKLTITAVAQGVASYQCSCQCLGLYITHLEYPGLDASSASRVHLNLWGCLF